MTPEVCDLRLEGDLVLEERLQARGVVLINEGQILWAGEEGDAPIIPARRTWSRPGGLICPGFVDLHIHGGGGVDAADGLQAALLEICRVHARHGTTAFCPTVLCSAPSATLRALEVIRAAALGDSVPGAARVLGANLEGPFLSSRYAGAQPREHLRAPDPVLLDELLAAAGPTLRIMTLAPELPGALELVARLQERGVIVGMGHSNATYSEAMAAIDAGARLGVHTFNAMRGLHHREVGLLGAVLNSPRVVAEVIADLHHVSVPALQLLRSAKGQEGVALISDCTAALDADPGAARLGQKPVEVKNGAVRFPDGTLAGSALSMERAVGNWVEEVGVPLIGAIHAASLVPARLLGEVGGVVAGAPADLVLLDQRFRVLNVVLRGEPLHEDNFERP